MIDAWNSSGTWVSSLAIAPDSTPDFIVKLNGSTDSEPEQKFIVQSEGDIGIGSHSPSAALDVLDNGASGYIAEFRQAHTSNSAQIILDSPTDNNTRPASIDLANAGTIYWSLGQAYASHTSKAFHIATSKLQSNDTGAKLTISTGGDVGIGTFSPGRKLHLHEASSGQILQQITNDTTGVSSGDGFHIGLNSSEEVLIQNKENTKMTLFTNDNARITIANDGHCVFSNSIALGGETAAVNRFDDYETGTWTPNLSSNSSAVTWSAGDTREGIYTKIGRMVYAQFNMNGQLPSSYSSANQTITGLPFTASSVNQNGVGLVQDVYVICLLYTSDAADE